MCQRLVLLARIKGEPRQVQFCKWKTTTIEGSLEPLRRLTHSIIQARRRVQRGRDTCAECWQTRGEDTPMLNGSGCRVARFCSPDHQKMASKKAVLGGSLTMGRHKGIC
jgi:hypothetical protein